MDYETVVQELYQLRKDHGIHPTLEPVKTVLAALGNPQNNLSCIHVGGTNGKGSVCAFLSSIFSQAGVTYGRYTSPHLVDVRERFVVNNQQISKEDFTRLVKKIQETATQEQTSLTFFELMTALALLYFAEQNVQYAIIEVGLGGTWDATNVITPVVSVLTPISIDHTEFLGESLDLITQDKCGIIKQGVPLITCASQPTLALIKTIAQEKESSVQVAEAYTENIGLAGVFQKENAGVAATVAKLLSLSQEAITKGIAETTWKGRCEFLNSKLLIDGAHNVAGMQALAQYVEHIRARYPKVTIVFGVGKRKQWKDMLAALPTHDTLIVTQSQHEDALPAAHIGEGKIMPDAAAALHEAEKQTPEGLIVVCGSLFLLGEVINVINHRQQNL